MAKYTFFIETKDGELIYWRGLSYQKAQSLNAWTENFIMWSNISRFGWEEENESRNSSRILGRKHNEIY